MGENWHGLRFPFKTTAQNLFAEPGDIELVNSSINFILNTQIGEYITLPEFGSELPEDLFEPNDFVLQSLVSRHAVDALERWEPRLNVTSIRTVVEEHEIRLFLEYVLVASPGQIEFYEDTFSREGA